MPLRTGVQLPYFTRGESDIVCLLVAIGDYFNDTWYTIEQPQQGLVHNRPGSDLLLFTAQNTLAQNRSQRGVGVGSALKIPPHLNIASGDSGLVLNEIQVFPLNIG